jgi:hypothetical protein
MTDRISTVAPWVIGGLTAWAGVVHGDDLLDAPVIVAVIDSV